MTTLHDIDEPAAPQSGGGGFVRVRIDLSYDGTAFAGWAWQRGSNLRTVQGALEDALMVVLRVDQRLRTVCAGRTDAGVHARVQVAHVDVPAEVWASRDAHLVRRLNGVLSDDVRVTSVVEAKTGFDARFSPLRRRYAYRVDDHGVGLDPLRRHDVFAYGRPLNVARMNEASVALIGAHNFAAFCRAREGASSFRSLSRFGWARHDDGLVVATVVADAFCHSMVRSLVGCVLAVGDGTQPVEWPAQILAAAVRDPAVYTAAPEGLTLEGVEYPQDADLAARAAVTRNPRGAFYVKDKPQRP